jgi:hypothetical protein
MLTNLDALRLAVRLAPAAAGVAAGTSILPRAARCEYS